ncbi:beta-lactamase family protein [Spiractinospora alimapuensis]|uniref:serine hydrolase domain-containing protein n=1 Tax=Spiractinospora alimapuensis TaxID=2820884 RepID=UPI001F35C8B9|nr:serine hydrolase domain-containing protein [Spiractinospora alimapuensis]QVQ52768.1 beta-lactamase family protein [Spiractinospora alimapuensis]
MTHSGHAHVSVEDLLEWGRAEGVYSAAAWSVGTATGETSGGVVGTRSWGGEPVTRTDLFDLASVTKPLVGVVVMALLERGALALDSTVAELLPDFQARATGELTLRDLMLHTSGLPGRVPMYRTYPTRDAMVEGLRALPPPARPGDAVQYSSPGLMLVGMMAEAASGAPLDTLVEEFLTRPTGLTSTLFTPAPHDRARAVATEDCAWRGTVVAGEVHDENAVVLGGVAGHAGLFSTVDDLATLGAALVRNLTEPLLLHPITLAAMIENRTAGMAEGRGLTWQTADTPGSPAGDLVSRRTFGHTGFTGTSLYVDPDHQRYYVLLTNRVHPSREGDGIRRIRRAFHNMAAVG